VGFFVAMPQLSVPSKGHTPPRKGLIRKGGETRKEEKTRQAEKAEGVKKYKKIKYHD